MCLVHSLIVMQTGIFRGATWQDTIVEYFSFGPGTTFVRAGLRKAGIMSS